MEKIRKFCKGIYDSRQLYKEVFKLYVVWCGVTLFLSFLIDYGRSSYVDLRAGISTGEGFFCTRTAFLLNIVISTSMLSEYVLYMYERRLATPRDKKICSGLIVIILYCILRVATIEIQYYKLSKVNFNSAFYERRADAVLLLVVVTLIITFLAKLRMERVKREDKQWKIL